MCCSPSCPATRSNASSPAGPSRRCSKRGYARCWVGRHDLDPKLAGYLLAAREIGERSTEKILQSEKGRTPESLAREYLTSVFDYGLDTRHMESLRLFGEWLVADGLVAEVHIPAVVEPDETSRDELHGLLAAASA